MYAGGRDEVLPKAYYTGAITFCQEESGTKFSEIRWRMSQRRGFPLGQCGASDSFRGGGNQ